MLAESDAGIEIDSCGTMGSMWLAKGTHEAIKPGQAANAEACTSGYDNRCYETKQIQIKNCDDGYFVYNLPEVTNCLEGYCTM